MWQYNFYVKMDGEVFGPYSARQIIDLRLLDDILVTEESMNGEWHPACEFDFEDMARKESEASIKIETPEKQTNYVNEFVETNEFFEENVSGWNWGAFIFNWLWGVFNKIYWPIFVVIGIAILSAFGGWASIVASIADLVFVIYLGISGNELAWKAQRNSMSIEAFNEKQKRWNKAGKIVFWIAIGLTAIVIIAGLLSN